MMTFITLICVQLHPGTKIPIEKCEKYYSQCVKNIASLPDAKTKGFDEEKIAEILWQNPKARNQACK